MFISDEKLDVTQISLTGTRALALIGLLIIAPHSFDEIRNKFINMGIFEEKNSDDILRIDISTIKLMGCELSRPCISNNYKYVLKKHPFSLNLTKEEVKLLKRTYVKVKNNASLKTLIEYDDLFKKIADYVYDKEIKEQLLGISILKYYDVNHLKELISDSEKRSLVELVYKNPERKEEITKTLKLEKLVFQNDKIYIYGYDFEAQKTTVLLYKRIRKFISKRNDDKNIQTKSFIFTYQLPKYCIEMLSENEKILEEKENFYIVEGSFYNEFFAAQRVLSFGPKCVVLHPVEFQKTIIEKLKAMREVYNG